MVRAVALLPRAARPPRPRELVFAAPASRESPAALRARTPPSAPLDFDQAKLGSPRAAAIWPSGDARDSATAYHVDARAFSDLIDTLIADLDLLDSYTLVVLNPRRANMGAKYGYRAGFSDDEVEFLRGKRTELLREAKRRGGVRARAPAPTAPPRSTYTEYFRSVGRRKFGNDDRRKAGDAWARKAGKRLDAQEKVRFFLFLRTGN